ncbi:MAG: glycosyltransferase family 4 protein [Candidatus Acidiferrales bacterium]
MEKRIGRFEEMRDGGLQEPLRIGFVGTLARLYKGPDILLHAAALCSIRGLNFELSIVGSGRHVEDMRKLAKRLKIQDRTRFLGQISFGEPVSDFLDSIDLFVMPSRAEGLPRALLEAMARGCPCIGTDVGGIPELLAREDVIAPSNANLLARTIMRVAQNPELLKAMSLRNYERAKQFRPERLREAHRSFLKVVRARAEK